MMGITSVRVIKAQHLKKVRTTSQTIKRRPSPLEEANKIT